MHTYVKEAMHAGRKRYVSWVSGPYFPDILLWLLGLLSFVWFQFL